MTQKDYILGIAEDVDQTLAQIIHHKKIQDYQGALSLIEELFKIKAMPVKPMTVTSNLSTCFSRSCCAMTICTTYAVLRK